MRKFIIRVIWFALIVLAFVAGTTGGVYYHTELTVLWRGFFPIHTDVEPTNEPPPVDRTTTSVIDLPSIDQPLPLVYSDTLDEPTIQQYLKEGAVVLPLGTSFGESGNVVVTAHSSGTQAFGPYRFAFSQLSELEVGEEYSVSTPTATYKYRVYNKEVVWPHQVDKLPNDDRSTVTLVTCWPLWTNLKRLLVHSELVSVDYKI